MPDTGQVFIEDAALAACVLWNCSANVNRITMMLKEAFKDDELKDSMEKHKA